MQKQKTTSFWGTSSPRLPTRPSPLDPTVCGVQNIP